MREAEPENPERARVRGSRTLSSGLGSKEPAPVTAFTEPAVG